MAFPYKHVLLIGATAGIGRAMTSKLLSSGVAVTAVGRRTERLQEIVNESKDGAKADYETFDISNTSAAPKFAADVMKKHPDIDCVFLNAGLQRAHDWSKPESVDLKGFNDEMHTNFTSFVALTHAFLPLLQKKKENTGIIYTSTHLSHVPAFTLSAYSASKAALNSFILSVRQAMKGSSVRIIELSPPVVQTELHDYQGEHGRSMGMPVGIFTEQAYKGLCGEEDKVIVGGLGLPGTDAAKKMTDDFLQMVKLQEGACDTMSTLLRGVR